MRRVRFVILAVLCVAPQLRAAPSQAKVTPVEIVLVEAEAVTPAAVRQWKGEGFKAVAVVLDERTGEAAYRAAKDRDVPALEALSDQLYESCVTCHRDYRPEYGRGR